MSFLDFIGFKRAPALPEPAAVAPQTVVAIPRRPFINTEALDAAGLRMNMWVMAGQDLGILTGCRIDGLAEVTLQKPDGTTRMELDAKDQAVPAVRVVERAGLRHARIEEIPESRHEGADQLRSFGYISASEVV
jgi:hypothetical protein